MTDTKTTEENTQQLLSGCGILTEEDMDAMKAELVGLYDETCEIYAEGFINALWFVACPERAAIHGKTVTELAVNRFKSLVHDISVKQALKSSKPLAALLAIL